MYVHALNCGLRIRADFAAKQHISVTQAAKFLPFKETASRHVKFRKKKNFVKMILHLSIAATRSLKISVANFLFSEFDSKGCQIVPFLKTPIWPNVSRIWKKLFRGFEKKEFFPVNSESTDRHSSVLFVGIWFLGSHHHTLHHNPVKTGCGNSVVEGN